MDLAALATASLHLALALALPALLASLALGLFSALFEVFTHGQDPSLAFVPRLLAVAVALFVSRDFMTRELVHFAAEMFHTVSLVSR